MQNEIIAKEIIMSVNWLMSSGELTEDQVCELIKIRDNAKMIIEN